MAILYDRFRLYLNIDNPLYIVGSSGTIDGYQFTSPAVDVGKYPDKVTDVRFGFDARLLGEVGGPLRLGLGAQIYVPSGERATYVTDGNYRGMIRALIAGNSGAYAYAAQVGVHIRPRDNVPIPNTPRGSELLFGTAGGPKFPITCDGKLNVIIGPEIYGQTAFRWFLGATTTAVEALATARLEQTRESGSLLRFKLGAGTGIQRQFGAPEWRVLAAIELQDRVK
jgi:hypothetical protein